MPITVKHTKVSAIPDAGDANLVQPSDWNADHTLIGLGTMAEQNANNVAITGGSISGVTIPASNVTGTLQVNQGGTGATTLTGYVKGTGTTAMTASATIPNTDITGLGTASTKDAGVANGVATLDAGGKVPVSELPAAVLGALNYQGTWNASTNTPTLTSSVGTKGYYYVVSVAGNTNLDGITDWLVGDWAVYNGTVWQKVDNTETVTSVNGQTGAVVLTTTNIAEGTNQYFTQSRARQSLSAGTGISYDNTTGVITNSSPSLGGDVVGPASATDNAIARFDTTTGKLIQNSVVTVSDTGDIAGATTITDINYVDFNTAYSTTLGAGQLGWDGNNTLGLGMSGGNIVQEIGLQTYIYGKASSAITKGQLIKKTGANGSSGVITFAPTTANMTNSGDVIGIAAENIALNGFGYITSVGNLRGFDTTGSSAGETWADGDTLYYNPAGNGLMTKTKPSAPNIKTEVAIVTNAGSGGSGSVVVEIIHGSVLGGTDSNVQISSATGGQLLSYDQTNQYWKNTNLAAGTGISVSSATGGTITVTNSAPDQTVAIASGTGISVTGTYPNFTVTNTSPSSGGTVTSITAGTGLTGGTITTSGTIAIDSTVATLTGSQTLTNKTISGASNTLTNIGNSSLTNSAITINGTSTSLGGSINVGTVTSVAATAGTGISISGSPITSSGTLTITNTAPDQTVAISAGTGISVTGTYPSFTVTNTAPAVNFTYTTNYIPYGQGTTTPNQSANFTFDGTTQSAPIQRASNGIVTNNKTISASFTIPSTDNAMSSGPVTLGSGVSVTVSSGSRWVVL